MIDVKHHSRLCRFDIRFLKYETDWFIFESEDVFQRIEELILRKMDTVKNENEKNKPKFNFGTWLRAEFPVLPMIRGDIRHMIDDNNFVGCVYCADRKDVNGFILTKACMLDNQIFKKL